MRRGCGLNRSRYSRPSDSEWAKRRRTLERHGATSDEIRFLRTRRVELNAMTSPQLVAFLETAFQRHGVEKLIPEPAVLDQHARYLLAQRYLADLVKQQSDDIAARAAGAKLPDDLDDRLHRLLAYRPELSWDAAIAEILYKDDDGVRFDPRKRLAAAAAEYSARRRGIAMSAAEQIAYALGASCNSGRLVARPLPSPPQRPDPGDAQRAAWADCTLLYR